MAHAGVDAGGEWCHHFRLDHGLLKFARHRQWLTHTWIQIPMVALALSCFAVAESLGGSGFIAAFSGGLLLAVLDGDLSREVKDEYLLASEGTDDTLALLTWVIFGSAVVGQAVGNFSWMTLPYSVLSLTVIRMLPVFLSLTGCGIANKGKRFIGWFGPRGLASIVAVQLEQRVPQRVVPHGSVDRMSGTRYGLCGERSGNGYTVPGNRHGQRSHCLSEQNRLFRARPVNGWR